MPIKFCITKSSQKSLSQNSMKKAYFEEKLKENTKNPKNLCKTLKRLGLLDKRLPSTNIWLEAKNGLTFDPYTISEVFKKLFSNLANDLVQKLLAAAKKFGNKFVEDYYNMFLKS